MTRILAGMARAAVCGPLLLGAVVSGCGTGFAADMHDHGKAPAPGRPAGPVREVALPEGLASAQSIALDSSGRVWFTEKVGRKLTVYDPQTKRFATHSLPASWENMGFSQITAGPDDEIWFTVNRWAEGTEEPHLLGRFTPADGYFTKLALPNDAIPQELMIDARGTIWFLAANKNSLYRIDPRTLALKGYAIPTANGHPRSLAAARNGHIWFVQANTNKIGVFVPERETFREYEVLTSFSNPGRLAIDGHGKIWFVEVTANRIGVFSPDTDRFDEVIVPTPASAPVALVSDDSGNVWFLEYIGNKVGVFNPESAVFHEYDIPTYGSLPTQMVLDRKRSTLWFTQSATEAKRLGMLSIGDALGTHGAGGGDHAAQSAPASQRFGQGMSGWLALLASIVALVALGGWLAGRSRKRRRAQGGP
jgi:virginiamycin B lyase